MKALIFLNMVFCLFGLTGNTQTNSSATGTLIIVISGFHNNHGNVTVKLFNREEGFPKLSDKAVGIIYSKIENNKAVAEFENLSKGEYAVSVYHDENNNKKMDTNIFGIPEEGVGASNDARGHFGPPKYKDAKFIFPGGRKTISINLHLL
jgi:uncharacterized protein (DUF2141 family)